MKNAITAMIMTILATIVATNGGDLYVTVASVLISIGRVVYASGIREWFRKDLPMRLDTTG